MWFCTLMLEWEPNMATWKPLMTEIESPAERANRILQGSSYNPIRHLTCRCDGGVLTIDGDLPTYHLKQVAQTLVQEIDGIVRIDNRVQVTAIPHS